MLLSFQMLPEQPASELLDAVALADELGYHGCYSADEIYHKDAWLLFAAAAQRTERVRLGPCVAPIYMREPTYVAQLAATLDELSGGRAEVVFGIGAAGAPRSSLASATSRCSSSTASSGAERGRSPACARRTR
jgi:5,10-methylenetetrahydromethanopterin reductase